MESSKSCSVTGVSIALLLTAVAHRPGVND
jgi:hypothetical protein